MCYHYAIYLDPLASLRLDSISHSIVFTNLNLDPLASARLDFSGGNFNRPDII